MNSFHRKNNNQSFTAVSLTKKKLSKQADVAGIDKGSSNPIHELEPLPETRCKYVHVRSDVASMRHTVSSNGSHSMPLTVNGTAVLKFISCSSQRWVTINSVSSGVRFNRYSHISRCSMRLYSLIFL